MVSDHVWPWSNHVWQWSLQILFVPQNNHTKWWMYKFIYHNDYNTALNIKNTQWSLIWIIMGKSWMSLSDSLATCIYSTNVLVLLLWFFCTLSIHCILYQYSCYLQHTQKLKTKNTPSLNSHKEQLSDFHGLALYINCRYISLHLHVCMVYYFKQNGCPLPSWSTNISTYIHSIINCVFKTHQSQHVWPRLCFYKEYHTTLI